jgi:hypothetical protein
MNKREQLVQRLLKVAGTTYVSEAGIRVDDDMRRQLTG